MEVASQIKSLEVAIKKIVDVLEEDQGDDKIDLEELKACREEETRLKNEFSTLLNEIEQCNTKSKDLQEKTKAFIDETENATSTLEGWKTKVTRFSLNRKKEKAASVDELVELKAQLKSISDVLKMYEENVEDDVTDLEKQVEENEKKLVEVGQS